VETPPVYKNFGASGERKKNGGKKGNKKSRTRLWDILRVVARRRVKAIQKRKEEKGETDRGEKNRLSRKKRGESFSY